MAETHLANLETLSQAALNALALAIRAGSTSPEAWRDAVANIGQDLLSLQSQAAAQADGYVTAALTAQGASPAADAAVNSAGFTDLTDGGGSWLRNLIFAPNSVVGQALVEGLSRPAALARGQMVANSIVLTGMQDVGRSAVQTATLTRPTAKNYVRMPRRPSCARCAILAGRRYRALAAFKRHPRCDCIHVPAAEDANDWVTNPVEYFKSLSTADQDRIFGKATARAIRDSDYSQTAMNQLVNAREGIDTVTTFGRQVQITRTGTTTRSTFGGYEVLEDGTFRRRSDSDLRRTGYRQPRVAKEPRLLPDEIYSLADEFGWDRAEVLRQLRRFAYIV